MYQIKVDVGDFEADSTGAEIGDNEFLDFDVDVIHPPESKYTITHRLISKFKNEKAFDIIADNYVTCAATNHANSQLFMFSWGPLFVIDLKEEKVTTYED